MSCCSQTHGQQTGGDGSVQPNRRVVGGGGGVAASGCAAQNGRRAAHWRPGRGQGRACARARAAHMHARARGQASPRQAGRGHPPERPVSQPTPPKGRGRPCPRAAPGVRARGAQRGGGCGVRRRALVGAACREGPDERGRARAPAARACRPSQRSTSPGAPHVVPPCPYPPALAGAPAGGAPGSQRRQRQPRRQTPARHIRLLPPRPATPRGPRPRAVSWATSRGHPNDPGASKAICCASCPPRLGWTKPPYGGPTHGRARPLVQPAGGPTAPAALRARACARA